MTVRRTLGTKGIVYNREVRTTVYMYAFTRFDELVDLRRELGTGYPEEMRKFKTFTVHSKRIGEAFSCFSCPYLALFAALLDCTV